MEWTLGPGSWSSPVPHFLYGPLLYLVCNLYELMGPITLGDLSTLSVTVLVQEHDIDYLFVEAVHPPPVLDDWSKSCRAS